MLDDLVSNYGLSDKQVKDLLISFIQEQHIDAAALQFIEDKMSMVPIYQLVSVSDEEEYWEFLDKKGSQQLP